jgi:hypothetical protein
LFKGGDADKWKKFKDENPEFDPVAVMNRYE